MSNRRNYKVVPGVGDFCPRCKLATQIREHIEVTAKQRRQPYYYSRWFNCTNPNCQTSLIMPERFKVHSEQELAE